MKGGFNIIMNEEDMQKAKELFQRLQGINQRKTIEEGIRFLQINEELNRARRLVECRM